MVFITKPNALADKCDILPQRHLKSIITRNIEVCELSQKHFENDILTESRLRIENSPARQNTSSPISLKKDSKSCLHRHDSSCNINKYNDIIFCSNMTDHVYKTENAIEPRLSTSASSEDNRQNSTSCYKMQSEFRRCGWICWRICRVVCWYIADANSTTSFPNFS